MFDDMNITRPAWIVTIVYLLLAVLIAILLMRQGKYGSAFGSFIMISVLG